MLTIIDYTPAYEDELMALIQREGPDWKVYWEEPNASRYRKCFADSITVLALADGAVCGYCRAMRDALYLYVCDLLVNAAYRGNGLGRRMMERLREQYPAHPLYVMSGNDGYYEHLGCKKEGSIYLL